ncbi:hypothetical protein AIOL_000993 [Candidatus Rhodobacter oscarellae]|uniref:SnoaL-like domain-containing protein n=1 Tax=Candidatus Rhodobacter oscarellae TaxID=1675527 RepID=A0A0J9H5G0_9RHOB|nr:hypothetical protein [Candidatus Rhodobacter lobularis]KMW60828.1 hypothetical protein AIOL_000993 [Candidatus Rhodobacter lobularis]
MVKSLNDFFTAWTMTEEQGRDAQIASATGDRIYYSDPRTEGVITDLDTLCGYVAQFLPMCPPGAKVTVADPVDSKDGHARATVHFVMSEEMQQTGQYFAELDGYGKITRLVGFAGKGAE